MGNLTDTVSSSNVLRTVLLAASIATLVACSSAPTSAPWRQADDSPWSTKHKSAEDNVYGNSASTEAPVNDPVLIAEKEPEVGKLESNPPELIEPETIKSEPVAEVAVVKAAEKPLSNEQQVLAMDPTAYAVQVYASSTVENTERFMASKDMESLMVVRTKRDDKMVYVLIDVHNNLAEAKQAAGYLEAKAGAKPWIRSISGLQKIIELE